MTVSFHIGQAGVADPELAELLRDVSRAAGDHPDTRRAGKVIGALANGLDPAAGVQLGSADMPGLSYHERVAAGDVLAAGVVRAQEGGHPAAGRLSAVAERWSEFTAAAEAVA